ncbi:F0F1 ATP synthase subunit delta [Halorhodospira abdelmalekii]|uniref:F0F1 ATP synthase subunit delta n=1 Tax=Halorhodospira abdelmalekii TaxID=421629 RepID=UPI001907AB92|nr:F0F1 ATP synthase subunit delta [Halorhodospira abdelmalekii]MBK1734228.1 F0F1 ATP synthase subunit delta [Halorhodospira abdelmalekii]
MAERSTLARPYAKAIYELVGDSSEQRKQWSERLAGLSTLVQDAQMAPLLGHPRVSAQQLTELIEEALGGGVDEQVRNLIRLLAENRRLGLAPEVHRLYETLRAEAENKVEVEVVSAHDLDEGQRKRLSEALSKRLNKQVELTTRVDETLIGGAIIHAGDTTIDGSVRGKLARLSSALVQ